jgi:hypothetical protein
MSPPLLEKEALPDSIMLPIPVGPVCARLRLQKISEKSVNAHANKKLLLIILPFSSQYKFT